MNAVPPRRAIPCSCIGIPFRLEQASRAVLPGEDARQYTSLRFAILWRTYGVLVAGLPAAQWYELYLLRQPVGGWQITVALHKDTTKNEH